MRVRTGGDESFTRGEDSDDQPFPVDTDGLDTDEVVVAMVVDRLTEDGDPVQYDRVIQATHAEYGMSRPEVERAVESLVEEDVVRRQAGDWLILC